MVATDEVWRLQRGYDPESVFFQKMANQGHYGHKPGSTRQGIYVCAPSGKFLASINSNNPDAVLGMLNKGLKAWNDLADSEKWLAQESKIKPSHRWEDSYPKDGLVLNMYTRDIPARIDQTSQPTGKWNQDRVWFSSSEMMQWIPAKLEAGESIELPRKLLERMVRFHLVDTVKGQAATFNSQDISDETGINVRVLGVSANVVELRLSGQTRAEFRSSRPRGVSTKLLGFAKFDLTSRRFTEFEIVALGNRWGQSRFNGRGRDPDKSPVGFLFRLAGPDEPRIPPAFVFFYNTEWIARP